MRRSKSINGYYDLGPTRTPLLPYTTILQSRSFASIYRRFSHTGEKGALTPQWSPVTSATLADFPDAKVYPAMEGPIIGPFRLYLTGASILTERVPRDTPQGPAIFSRNGVDPFGLELYYDPKTDDLAYREVDFTNPKTLT